MQQADQPKQGFKMPEIIIEHESWGSKLARAFFPTDWKRWVGIGGNAAEIAILASLAKWCNVDLTSWSGLLDLLIVFYLSGSIVTFLVDAYVTLKRFVKARKVSFNL